MCKFPNCRLHPQPNGYCIGHQAFAKFKSVKVPKKQEKKSDTRKEDDKKYKQIVKELAAKSNKCEIKSPVCTKIMEGLHHKVKRSPDTLLDKKNLLRACNACNNYCEEHPKWALENLVSESKFKQKNVIIAERDDEVNATIIQ